MHKVSGPVELSLALLTLSHRAQFKALQPGREERTISSHVSEGSQDRVPWRRGIKTKNGGMKEGRRLE